MSKTTIATFAAAEISCAVALRPESFVIRVIELCGRHCRAHRLTQDLKFKVVARLGRNSEITKRDPLADTEPGGSRTDIADRFSVQADWVGRKGIRAMTVQLEGRKVIRPRMIGESEVNRGGGCG